MVDDEDPPTDRRRLDQKHNGCVIFSKTSFLYFLYLPVIFIAVYQQFKYHKIALLAVVGDFRHPAVGVSPWS